MASSEYSTPPHCRRNVQAEWWREQLKKYGLVHGIRFNRLMATHRYVNIHWSVHLNCPRCTGVVREICEARGKRRKSS